MNSINCQIPAYFQIFQILDAFQNEKLLEILQHFGIAEGEQEVTLKCWHLQQNVEDLVMM